ncbi:uncharacterized protein Tco025E_09166 [Trypanosoma conorhini]|uniref:Uncharacterized protein n=1 Tax=Trypanosoma conorhini TaxID=83891 RepID=A0A422MZW7_9TRYP|nr:uncharacterized protein Tco025E_09166 [Trypanosoma conorhini]RNE98774.1 hypothetical protein Tco025E_09166 [Trypanosoma conorhini]
MGIVPLERLSLTHSCDVRAVTGATPFHSLCEFVAWAKSRERGNLCAQVGEIDKVVTLYDGRIWIYGKGKVATIVVPIRNPFALNAILRDCEHASHLARAVLSGIAEQGLVSIGNYETFLAEYLQRRYVLYSDKNKYIRELVFVLRFTLLSHASNAGFSPNAFSHSNYVEVGKKATKAVSPASAFCESEEKKGDETDLMRAANTFEERRMEGICQLAELIWTAIDNASLLFRVKESI